MRLRAQSSGPLPGCVSTSENRISRFLHGGSTPDKASRTLDTSSWRVTENHRISPAFDSRSNKNGMRRFLLDDARLTATKPCAAEKNTGTARSFGPIDHDSPSRVRSAHSPTSMSASSKRPPALDFATIDTRFSRRLTVYLIQSRSVERKSQ